MTDMVKEAVIERLQVLGRLAARLEQLLQGEDISGMVVCRLGLDADHAVAALASHDGLLERPPT